MQTIASAPSPRVNAADRLIIALDRPYPTSDQSGLIEIGDAMKYAEELDGVAHFFKVGWSLYIAGGQAVVRQLVARGRRVFLDLKFGDIPETVGRFIRAAVDDGVDLVTLNSTIQCVEAAVAARRPAASPRILMVTVLTSQNQGDLVEAGRANALSLREEVIARARQAIDAGCDGVIASANEAADIRKMAGPGPLIVAPGIRPSGLAVTADDQKRVATPAGAIEAGADYLVVGRPITMAPSPRIAAQAVLAEMQQAFDRRGL